MKEKDETLINRGFFFALNVLMLFCNRHFFNCCFKFNSPIYVLKKKTEKRPEREDNKNKL